MTALAVVPLRHTLYDIQDHIAALIESAETVAPEQEAEFLQDFQHWLEARGEKVDSVAQFMCHLESQIDLAKSEIERLRDRKHAYEIALERLKSYVVRVMEASGQKKLEGHTVTLSIRKCPASVEIVNEPEISPDYKVVSLSLPARLLEQVLDAIDFNLAGKVLERSSDKDVTVDKRALLDALKAKTPVSGARLAPEKHSLVRK